jgi:hypothetical protein
MSAIRVLIIFLLVLLSVPAKSDVSTVVLGSGSASCNTWSGDRQRNQSNSQLNQAWVLGYVTAYNFHKPTQDSMTKPMEPRQIMLWIDNYCDANPEKNIADAAKALIEELTGRGEK